MVRGEGRWKHLETWFDAMETRPAYLGTRSDHYTHVHDLPPQLGGKAIPSFYEFTPGPKPKLQFWGPTKEWVRGGVLTPESAQHSQNLIALLL